MQYHSPTMSNPSNFHRRLEHSQNSDPNHPGKSDSFWTICPHCHYIFEYLKLYENCHLKCQKCNKAFHGAPIGNPPPEAVVEKGEYPFTGGNVWSPFSAGGEKKGNVFIEISDEEIEDVGVNLGGGEEGPSGKIVCGMRVKIVVPMSSRKVAGKGVRIGRDEALGIKRGNVGVEDDIFVGLQDIGVGII